MSRKASDVVSDFNRDERFDCENIPKHFDSVTDESIKMIQDNCSETIQDKYKDKYNARSLRAMIETIDGKFDLLYSRLEGDYAARIANLERCRTEEMEKVRSEITSFKSLINDYKCALERYSNNVYAFNGTRITEEGLAYDEEKGKQFEDRYNNIKGAKE